MQDPNNSIPAEVPAEMPQLTTRSVAYLYKAAKWGKFLAILGFILAGLMIVAGILMSLVMNLVTDEVIPLNIPFSPQILSIIYIAIACIYLVPVFFLNSFSNNVIKAVKRSSTENMTTSLRNLKNLFVFIGVSTIAIIALYTIVLIVIGTAALFSF